MSYYAPYRVGVIMRAYFAEHDGAEATPAEVTAWAVPRWPEFTKLMAEQWFYRSLRLGRVVRVPAGRREPWCPWAYRVAPLVGSGQTQRGEP